MKKFILAITLILPLSGCAGLAEKAFNLPTGILTTTVKNPVTKQELAVVENSVIIARKLGLRYIHLGACATGQIASLTNPCADARVISIIKSSDAKIRIALPIARKFIKDNDTINAATALAAVKDAVSDIRAVIGQ